MALNRLKAWERERVRNAHGYAWAADNAIAGIKEYLRRFRIRAKHSMNDGSDK